MIQTLTTYESTTTDPYTNPCCRKNTLLFTQNQENVFYTYGKMHIRL